MNGKNFENLCTTIRKYYGKSGPGIDYEAICNQALLEWGGEQRGLTFKEAITQIDPFNPPYLFLSICRKDIIDEFRKLNRRKERGIEWLDSENFIGKLDAIDQEEDKKPCSIALRMTAIESCFQRANEKTCEAVKLKLQYGYSAREIAELLGLSQTAVENRISRFRASATEQYDRLCQAS